MLLACIAPLAHGQQTGLVDFGRQVRPILASKCVVCHSDEKRSGGLSLVSLQDALNGGRNGAAVKPGKSGDSLLVQRLTADGAGRMPLGGKPLAPSEIALIRAWIDEGARATPTSPAAKAKWEAPLSLEMPAVPAPLWKTWDKPLDRFVAQYLQTKGVAEPAVISDAIFARRAYLDIWGLLPPPAELAAFVASADPEKRGKLVSRLLAGNRNYAEHWISFWNDLLRNDEGANYHSETASRKSITPWLLAALETNMPYRELVQRLLNPAQPNDPEGFLIGVNWRGTISASQTPAMQAAQNTAQVFLGVNLKCNSCHDSFISRWKLKDAYAMAGFFSPDPKLELYRCDVAQQQFAEAAFLYPALNRAPASMSLADRRAAAAAIFTDARNGRLARTVVNRIWERMMGRGFVADSDDMDGEPWSPELLDWLSADFVEHGYDLKRLVGTVAMSRAYQMQAVVRKAGSQPAYVFQGPEVRRLTAEEFADSIGAITGEWHVYQPGGAKAGAYTREWRVAANPLSKALGRPIRDQVYSSRDNQATTLQALELVNGEALTHRLSRGAKKLLGELPPEPVSIFDKTYGRTNPVISYDLDIGGAKKIWLVVQDRGSYSPEKVEAMWADAVLTGPQGNVRLSSLKPLSDGGLRAGTGPDGVRVKTPSTLVYDIAGKGFTRLQGKVGIENKEITSELNPQLRFFVFNQEPNPERMTPVDPEPPLPAPPEIKNAGAAVDWVFQYALGRPATPAERRVLPAQLTADSLADLLWAVMMKPEFQLLF